MEPQHQQRLLVAGREEVQVWSLTTGWRSAVVDRLPLGGVGGEEGRGGRVLQVRTLVEPNWNVDTML